MVHYATKFCHLLEALFTMSNRERSTLLWSKIHTQGLEMLLEHCLFLYTVDPVIYLENSLASFKKIICTGSQIIRTSSF